MARSEPSQALIAQREVQVLGPFNSGTCLMFNYIHRLFRVHTTYNRRFWKHSLPPEYRRFSPQNLLLSFPADAATFANTTFIVMVRNPYFWLASTARRPYLLRFPRGVETAERRLASTVCFFGREFGHLVDVWSAYYRAYRHELTRRAEVIYVRLEDLVEDPHGQLNRLRQRLPGRCDVDWNAIVRTTFEQPAKAHGEPCTGGDEARRIYQAHRISETLGDDTLASVRSRIDEDLMRHFGYPLAGAPRESWSPPRITIAGSSAAPDPSAPTGRS